MDKQIPGKGFTREEFVARLAKMQEQMRAQSIDIVLLNSEPEVRYFSGFYTLFWQSPSRPWFLLLPQEGNPVAVIPEIGAELMRGTWVDDVRTWSSPQPEDEGVSLLVDTLHELSGKTPRIGLMQGDESVLRMPLRDLDKLYQHFPKETWCDVTPLIRALRMVKSEAEIAKIRYIATQTSHTFNQADALFYSGQPLDEAFRAFKIALLKNGADDVPYLVGGAGQGGYRDVISPPSAAPLQKGDIFMLDTGAVYDGYFCDFDRNMALGYAN